VDSGIPYNDGPLEVADIVVTISIDESPKHVKGTVTVLVLLNKSISFQLDML